jgi:hypothetical protein
MANGNVPIRNVRVMLCSLTAGNSKTVEAYMLRTCSIRFERNFSRGYKTPGTQTVHTAKDLYTVFSISSAVGVMNMQLNHPESLVREGATEKLDTFPGGTYFVHSSKLRIKQGVARLNTVVMNDTQRQPQFLPPTLDHSINLLT